MEAQAPKRRRESAASENVEMETDVRTDEIAASSSAAPQGVEINGETSVQRDESDQDQGPLSLVYHPGTRLFKALKIGFLTDVTIIVGNEAIKCHSQVVSIASTKLAAILKENEPRLPDVDPRHFHLLLEIIYTGKLARLPRDKDTLLQVGHLAHDLQVFSAVDYCAESFVAMKVDVENFWAILDFAYLINDEKLKHHCLFTSCIKAGSFLQEEEFLKCKLNRLELILSQDTLFNVTELQLFQACVAWANANSDDAESRRAALGPALKLIRFRLFTAEDVSEHVCPTGLLSAEDERDILRSCATGKNLMPVGFSVSTSPRDLGRIVEYKLSSSGETKPLEELPENVQNSLIIHANKRIFIVGVKLRACRSNLPDGCLFEEKVLITLQDKLSDASMLPLYEFEFRGQVKNGDVITINFNRPMQIIPYNHYVLYVGYCEEGAASPSYQLYKPEIISRDESELLIRNLREAVAPPDLQFIVAEKVATMT